jgi:hypothetical protein
MALWPSLARSEPAPVQGPRMESPSQRERNWPRLYAMPSAPFNSRLPAPMARLSAWPAMP